MVLIVLALLLIVRAVETAAQPLAAGGRGRARGRLRREAARVAGGAAGARADRLSRACPGPRRRRLAQVALAGVVYVVGRAGLADRDADRTGQRPAVRDRLDQRQRLERRVRLQRHRPPGGQIARNRRAPSMNRATTTRRPRSPSATTSRSSPPPPRACWRGSARCPGERLGMEVLVALLLGIPALLLGPAGRRCGAGSPSALRGRHGAQRAAARPRQRGSPAGEPARTRAPVRSPGRRRNPGARAGGAADAPRGRRRADRVDAHRDRPVQPHDPPAPPLRRGLHAGRSRRCWASASPGRVAPRGRLRLGALLVVHARGRRLLRRAAALRATRRSGGSCSPGRSGAIALAVLAQPAAHGRTAPLLAR